jgi:predicted Zn-dependent peptidase
MSATSQIQLDPVVQTLSNGLTVVMETIPYVHSVSVGVWVKTGSANEQVDLAGISHFLEHMVFKGTETRTSREIMEAVESRGGLMNAFTSKEYTCYYVKMLDKHLDVGLDVLSDIMKNNVWSDLEKERNVILEEIAAGVDVPDDHIHDMMAGKVWPNHALGRSIAGDETTVSNTTLDDIKAYKQAWYRPDNMLLSIVGNFDESETLDRIRSYFGDIETTSNEHSWETPARESGVLWEERDIAQNHVALSFPGTSILGVNRYKHDMLSSIFGGGSTSRLFDTIREEAGLAYSIYSYNSMYQQTGALGVYAAVAPENTQTTLDLIADEIKKLQDTPLGEDELNSNREQLKGGLLLALEGTFNRMSRMGRSLLFFDRVIPVSEILESVDSVTVDDIQTLAQETFTQEHTSMAVLGPKHNATEASLNL